MEDIRIEEALSPKDEYVEAVCRLLRQLTPTPISFTHENLVQIVSAESSRLFFIYLDGQTVGMLTLGSYLSPTGPKSWIEDVVVDQQYRGRALGRQLVEFAIREAGKVSGTQLMLTSKPARVAANALYRTVGFQAKETNVYKMNF